MLTRVQFLCHQFGFGMNWLTLTLRFLLEHNKKAIQLKLVRTGGWCRGAIFPNGGQRRQKKKNFKSINQNNLLCYNLLWKQNRCCARQGSIFTSSHKDSLESREDLTRSHPQRIVEAFPHLTVAADWPERRAPRSGLLNQNGGWRLETKAPLFVIVRDMVLYDGTF